MSSNTAANNKMKNTSSIVYRSKLFNTSEPAPAKQQQSSKPAFKTFCKVCQDAGKLEQEFTNHNVRDRTGKTVCPTLLAQECRNCFKRGHTVKYCSLLKEAPAPVLKKPAKKPDATRSKNVFMLLESDSEDNSEDDELDEQEQEVTEFPALQSVTVTNQKPVLNYGRIIDQANNPDLYAKAKEAQKEAERQKEMVAWAKAEAARQLDDEKERQSRDARLKIPLNKSSWVDAESSDEEEDDEYNDYEQAEQVKVEVVDNSAW